MAKKQSTEEISHVLEVSQGQLTCHVIGLSPLVLNRVSEKAKRELLMPAGRKTASVKATSLKHDPLSEFRASAYTLTEGSPTLLAMMSTAFKGALRNAALDLPGMKKAQIGRLTYIDGDYIGVYGVPQIYMAIVRSADMNKTPDVRTRAILPKWACSFTVTFVEPLIRAQAVANLLAAAGQYVGVGDGRPEKGAMSFGRFALVSADDPTYRAIIASGGRQAQETAMDTPACYDTESAELLEWFDAESGKRKLRGVA